MKYFILFIIFLILIKYYIDPSIDETRDGDVLLHYGRSKRNYIKLFNRKDFM